MLVQAHFSTKQYMKAMSFIKFIQSSANIYHVSQYLHYMPSKKNNTDTSNLSICLSITLSCSVKVSDVKHKNSLINYAISVVIILMYEQSIIEVTSAA